MTISLEVDSSTPGKAALLEMWAITRRFPGVLALSDVKVTFTNPRQTQAAGITTIYQELNQVSQLSITKNIFLGSENV